MLINHQSHFFIPRIGIILKFGLSIDQRGIFITFDVRRPELVDRDFEEIHHSPVLHASDDPFVHDPGLDPMETLREILERHGRRDGIRIGIIMRDDQKR